MVNKLASKSNKFVSQKIVLLKTNLKKLFFCNNDGRIYPSIVEMEKAGFGVNIYDEIALGDLVQSTRDSTMCCFENDQEVQQDFYYRITKDMSFGYPVIKKTPKGEKIVHREF